MTSLSRVIAYAAMVVALSASLVGTPCTAGARDGWSTAEVAAIASMRLKEAGARPADPSNAYEQMPAAADLGKQLFQDTGLSRNGGVACASCHLPGAQFQDGRPRGQGVGAGHRRTMPVMGAAQSPFLFWDGRKDSLWSQALGPWEDGLEHGSNRVALVSWVRTHCLNAYEQVFGKMPELGSLPEAASPNGTDAERAVWAGMTDTQRERINRVFANMGKSIAAYERNISYGESRFDRYAEAIAVGAREGQQILTAQEIRGLRLFLNQGQCATCHNGPLLTDHAFHNTGVPPVGATAPDEGRAVGVRKLQQDEFNCLGRYSDARPEQCTELQFLATDDPAQLGAFRTPSLRNVAARAPYMHAGQFSTLDQVIEHYALAPAAIVGHSELARPGASNAERRVIRLSSSQIQDIKAFLATLTGPVVELAGKQSEAMAPYHVRFHRDRPVIAVIAENSGTELVDFVVPYGVLARSGVADVIAVATREGAVTMRPALQIQPQATIAQFDARFPEGADYVIVPLVVQWKDPVLLGWIKAQAEKGGTMVSICDGAIVLAEAGLLQRRRATAHWASESMRRDRYRQTQWVNNARYVVDGPVASSAGISAALPMSLAIVEAIAGHEVAATVAGKLGATDWSPAHDSERFASGHGALFDALSAMQITNRLLHSTQSIGIAVARGVDEVTLALTADAYSRTGRSQAFAISDAPVLTQHGLTILPARIGAASRIEVMLPAFDATPPARIIDQALAGIATRYGRSTAYNVAAAFEYWVPEMRFCCTRGTEPTERAVG